MNSKRRDFDSNYFNNTGTFIATVQNRSIKKQKLTLTDVVQVFDDGTEKFISPHMHVFNITKEQMVGIQIYDIITFNAIAYKYTKARSSKFTIENCSLEFVTNIEIVGGEYNE